MKKHAHGAVHRYNTAGSYRQPPLSASCTGALVLALGTPVPEPWDSGAAFHRSGYAVMGGFLGDSEGTRFASVVFSQVVSIHM